MGGWPLETALAIPQEYAAHRNVRKRRARARSYLQSVFTNRGERCERAVEDLETNHGSKAPLAEQKLYTEMIGKGKGGRGRSALNRVKPTGPSGGPGQQKPTLKGFWACGCGGPNAEKNFGWRLRCVACDELRPKKIVHHSSEIVDHQERERPWSGESRFRASEKEVQRLKALVAVMKTRETARNADW